MQKNNFRLRPRTPDYNEGERRYTSDERRRTFERMTRNEPAERPADWSDSGVRYRYYRDGGFFKDRPCSFDEFIKWEEWWYKYRDWLAQEGYYDQQAPPPQGESGYGPPPPVQQHRDPRDEWGHHHPPPPHGGMEHVGGGGGYHQPPPQRQYRDQQHPPPRGDMGGGFVPLGNRANFGRPDGSAYLQAGLQTGIRRRIGRTTNGSLVVNIRQGGGSSGLLAPPPPNGFRTQGSMASRLQHQVGGPPHHHRR